MENSSQVVLTKLMAIVANTANAYYSVFEADHLCGVCIFVAFLPSAFALYLGDCVRASPVGKLIYIKRESVKVMSFTDLSYPVQTAVLCYTRDKEILNREMSVSSMILNKCLPPSLSHHLYDDPYSDWNHFTPQFIYISHRCGQLVQLKITLMRKV